MSQKKIKVKRKWFLKTHYCRQCQKPLHQAVLRITPKTATIYCEGCAIDKRLIG